MGNEGVPWYDAESYPGVHERECFECDDGTVIIDLLPTLDSFEPNEEFAPCPRCKGTGRVLSWEVPQWL